MKGLIVVIVLIALVSLGASPDNVDTDRPTKRDPFAIETFDKISSSGLIEMFKGLEEDMRSFFKAMERGDLTFEQRKPKQ